jgi:hypothetical protein
MSLEQTEGILVKIELHVFEDFNAARMMCGYMGMGVSDYTPSRLKAK